MTEATGPKKRGRPPAPEEGRRRFNLTFRIRGDLKEKIASNAERNGRSISEEMEAIIDGFHIQEDLLRSKDREIALIERNFAQLDASIRSMVDRYAKADEFRSAFIYMHSQNVLKVCNALRWTSDQNKSMHIDLIENAAEILISTFANNMSREQALSNLDVTDQYMVALRREITETVSKIDLPVTMRLMTDLLSRLPKSFLEFHSKSGAPIPADYNAIPEDIRVALTEKYGDRTIELYEGAQKFSALSSVFLSEARKRQEQPNDEDFSIEALRQHLNHPKGEKSAVRALRQAGWPNQFEGLPAGTRAVLIGEMRDAAPRAYESMMSPSSKRTEALDAFRRIERVLLRRIDEEDGPDDLSDDT